jgi:RNA polymerase sigma factor (TIGR02999 family)
MANRLFAAVHGELRRIAGRLMRDERPGHTMQATELVHEAYLRLVDDKAIGWQGRAHFFGVAARAMRQILVDHARERAAAKRGGGLQRVALDDRVGLVGADVLDLLDLDRVLTGLAAFDERMAKVVEYRVFAGMSVEEVALVLGVSARTVHNDWRVAKMWLSRQLAGGGTPRREEARDADGPASGE